MPRIRPRIIIGTQKGTIILTIPQLPILGTPVEPFFPFYLGVSLLKLNSRKKGTLFMKGLLGNLVLFDGLCLQGVVTIEL